MNKQIRRIKAILSPAVVQARLKLVEAGNMDISPMLIALAGTTLLALLFIRTQLQIRPRLRLALGLIFGLSILLQASIVGISYLKPREAEIKINGKAILVAQDQTEADEAQVEISQNLNARLSPFEFRKPIDGILSQGYSYYHRANDIAGPLGSPIYPVGAGTVEFAGRVADGKGNVVIINHGDGLKSLYGHMGKIEVGIGDVIDTKTEIGTVGLTGHTTGPHVHLEIYDRENLVNPASVLPNEQI